MKRVLAVLAVVVLIGWSGCSRDGDPIGAGIGESGISGGAGGTGSGPTGTGGDVSGENPAGDDLNTGGTGTDAP